MNLNNKSFKGNILERNIQPGMQRIEIYNRDMVLKQQLHGTTKENIDITKLNPGIYQVRYISSHLMPFQQENL